MSAWAAVELDGDIGGCGECPPAFGIGTTCEGTVTVDITQANEQPFDATAAGSYVVAWCSGAFHYAWDNGGGWVITKWASGTFITIKSNSTPMNFSDETPAGVGYDTEADALAAGRCRSIRFLHPGGPITVAFSDVYYDDNVLGTAGAPTFALYRIVPHIRLNCVTVAGMVNEERVNVTLVLQNLTDGEHAITFTQTATDGVTLPQAPQTITFAPLETKQVGFAYNIETNKTDHIVTINLDNGGYDTMASIVIDMTPLFNTSWELGYDAGDDMRLIIFNWENDGNGPSWNMVTRLHPVGDTKLIDPNTMEEVAYYESTVIVGAYHPLCVGNDSAGVGSVACFARKDPATGSATVRATMQDSYQEYPAPENGVFTW